MYNFNENILRESKYTDNFTKKVITHFIEIWRNSSSNSRKLQLYFKIKANYEPERYLNVIKNEKLKKTLTKLRASNHILMIEQGRNYSVNIGFAQYVSQMGLNILKMNHI